MQPDPSSSTDDVNIEVVRPVFRADMTLENISAVGAPTDRDAVIGDIASTLTDSEAAISGLVRTLIPPTDRDAVISSDIVSTSMSSTDRNLHLPREFKTVYNGFDLYHQQRDPTRHCIGLQTLLDITDGIVRSLDWPRLERCRFAVNFGHPRSDDGTKTYVFKFNDPTPTTINVTHFVDPNTGQATWGVRIMDHDSVREPQLNWNVVSPNIHDLRTHGKHVGPRSREERVIDVDE